ncbi:MAG: ribonuclease HII [Bacteroidales bacterium]|nr:ribonuclease HII [Bacteroidales bacterium]
MLKSSLTDNLIEAGCDEAGRGCLAGPVFAAAVILPPGYTNPAINDSKKMSARQRENMRQIIEKDAVAWAVESVDHQTIDQINILNASILAMHQAIKKLTIQPQLILADGNRFHPYPGIPHRCIIKGDATYLSIAAASILAKTYRDDFMLNLDRVFPQYGWKTNKGYPTEAHRKAIDQWGITSFHRKSFHCKLTLDFYP